MFNQNSLDRGKESRKKDFGTISVDSIPRTNSQIALTFARELLVKSLETIQDNYLNRSETDHLNVDVKNVIYLSLTFSPLKDNRKTRSEPLLLKKSSW